MNILKRLSKLETTNKEWQPVFIAIMMNGRIEVSSNGNIIAFPNENVLDAWADENGLNDSDQIRLIKVMDPKGEPPAEL